MNNRSSATQVRALLWEEGRVGGSIAGACLSIGLLLMLANWLQYQERAWMRDEFLAGLAVIGIPVFVALLLVLNPDNAGHMVGGFSKRILRLPVKTSVAVAVSLAARTALVFAVSMVLIGLSSKIFLNSPPITAAILITIVYLIAQLADWLRGVISGITSLILCAAATWLVVSMWPGAPEFAPIRWAMAQFQRAPWLTPLAPIAGLLAAYAVSAVAVHAGRVGRTYGIPEIWEWPRYIKVSRAYRARPFCSAMAAQVWFELRRSRWVLPLGTALLWTLLAAGIVVSVVSIRYDRHFNPATSQEWWQSRVFEGQRQFGYLQLWCVVLAAAAQGTVFGNFRVRRIGASSQYDFLRPLTDAQFACAHSIALAILLLPTIALSLVLHFAVAGRDFVTNVIPDALATGVASPREMLFALLSRGLLIAAFAWPLLYIGTRFFRRMLGAAIAAGILLLLSEALPGIDVSLATADHGTVAVAAVVALAAAITLLRARNDGHLSNAAAARAALLWFTVSWLSHYAMTASWSVIHALAVARFEAVVTALGIGGLMAALPVSHLLDLSRRRHAAPRAQVPIQPAAGRPWNTLAAGGVVAAALFIWLGWPSQPAFIEQRRAQGYPVTLEELDASYTAALGKENYALRFLAMDRESERRLLAYWKEFDRAARSSGIKNWVDEQHNTPIVGGGELPTYGPISRKEWTELENYWTAVSEPTAIAMREFAGADTSGSRYPVDLKQIISDYSESKMNTRWLSQDLELDALIRTSRGEFDLAATDVEAIIALSSSLATEPLSYAAGGRFSKIRDAVNAIQRTLNRSTPDDAILARLQRACESALPPPDQGLAITPGLVGDSVIHAHYFISPFERFNLDSKTRNSGAMALAWSLYYPYNASATIDALEFNEFMTWRAESWHSLWDWRHAREQSDFRDTRQVLSSGTYWWSRYDNVRKLESELTVRTRLNLARTALGIERYRLANGMLPLTLDALVPSYLPEVPADLFARGPNIPIRYALRETSEYIVYSVAQDGHDNGGNELESRYGYFGVDIAFAVGPQDFRTAPQIAEK